MLTRRVFVRSETTPAAASLKSRPGDLRTLILADTTRLCHTCQPADPTRRSQLGKLVWISAPGAGTGQEGAIPAGLTTRMWQATAPGASFRWMKGRHRLCARPTRPDLVSIWRPQGDNKWADSTVALNAETGKIKWAFQNHRHDV